MTERIVDALEFVDVDIEHRQLLAGSDATQFARQLFVKQRPVRQVSQRVVVRQMGDLLVRALLFGDVFDGGNPAACFQRLVDDLDPSAARGVRDLTGRLAERNAADDAAAKLLDIAVKGPGRLPMCDQFLHAAARLGHVRRQPEHLDIALVANDDPGMFVVKNKPLRNIVDRGVQPLLFQGQALLRRAMLLRQFANDEEQHDRDHEHGEPAHADQEPGLRAPVGQRCRYGRRHGDQKRKIGQGARRR